MTTQLQAVSEILEALGEPPVTSLDTGGTSLEGEAETFLDRWRRRVLADGPGVQVNESVLLAGGWATNTEEDVDLNFASVSLTGTISTGTFTKGERVTQATSGAVGLIVDAYTTTDTTYLIAPISGTFNGANNITGGSSGVSTATISAVANPTSGIIPIEDDVFAIKPYNLTWPYKISERNRRLYDQNDNTFTFDDSVKVVLSRNLPIVQLPEKLAAFVIQTASYHLQRYKKRGQIDDQINGQDLIVARQAAIRESLEQRPINVLQTSGALSVKGRRRRYFDASG